MNGGWTTDCSHAKVSRGVPGRDWLMFRLERLLLRGTHMRLLVMAGLVGLVSIVGGAALLAFDAAEEPGKAFWWAFLRLSDPGYLGDDEGIAKRVISTVVTILGYVLFMGSLVAIMTQWLNETIRRLEQGMTPIVQQDHVLVCGWTSRTTTIAREMFLMQGRVQRFLARHQTKRLNLVLMVEQLSPAIRAELREDMGSVWDENHLVLRSGSSLHTDHLKRVAHLNAAAILLPSEDQGADSGNEDARTIKTLMAVSAAAPASDELPTMVTELFDTRKVKIARRAYRGPIEVIASDQLIGRLLALCTLNPGMGRVFDELLAYGTGSEIRIGDNGQWVGSTFGEIVQHYPRGVLMGTTRKHRGTFEADLCPRPSDVLQEGDRLVVLAEDHAHVEPSDSPIDRTWEEPVSSTRATPSMPVRVLVVGWSDRTLDLAAELEDHHGGELTIDVLSALPIQTREAALVDRPLLRAVICNIEGDTSRLSVIRGQLENAAYDHVVVMASDYFASYSQSDARSIVAFLLIEEVLKKRSRRPTVVIELMDIENRALLDDRDVDVVVSPAVIGRVLAHVTVRPELRCVYTEMLDGMGPCITLTPATSYGIDPGRHAGADLQIATERRGDILMGILVDGPRGSVKLNPLRGDRFTINERSLLVALRRPS